MGKKIKNLEKFWHSFQISLNYACKDFQFGTWLENRLQGVSFFPLASNPKISSNNIKNILLPINKVLFTFPQKARQQLPIECFSPSRNLLMQKQVRLRALDVIIFKPQARPPVKVNFKSWNSLDRIFKRCLREQCVWTKGNHKRCKEQRQSLQITWL